MKKYLKDVLSMPIWQDKHLTLSSKVHELSKRQKETNKPHVRKVIHAKICFLTSSWIREYETK